MRFFPVPSLVVAAFAGVAAAQPVVFTEWNFNNAPTGSVNNSPPVSRGHGTAVPLGMTNGYHYDTSPARTGSFTICDITGSGTNGDTGTPNNCWRVRGSYDGTLGNAGIGWALAAPEYTQGAEFDVSTLNYAGVTFSYNLFCTNQGVYNYVVQYSTDAGASWATFGGIQTTQFNGWTGLRTSDFTGVPGVDNNAGFRVRIVSVYDPTHNPPTYTASLDHTQPYNNNSGNWRFDRISFSGTPTQSIPPSILSMAVNNPAVCTSGGQLLFTVTAEPGVLPSSAGLGVTADLSPLGLSATQTFYDDGTHGDAFANDGVYSYTATVPSGRAAGDVVITATVSDSVPRSGTAGITVSVGDCSTNSASRVVVSQVYAGSGDPGTIPSEASPFDADFVEIYNRSNQVVSMDGWSVQYCSAASSGGFDNSDDRVKLSGLIQPGQYMLVRMSDSTPNFNPLPSSDFGKLPGLGGMANTGGRVALVRSTGMLHTDFSSALIEDFVGYGSALNFEGAAATASPVPVSNRALVRKVGGSQDTNQNFNDFSVAAPAPRNRANNGFLAGYSQTAVTAVCSGSTLKLVVAVSPGNTSSGITVTADVSDIVGSPTTVSLFDDGANGTHGDTYPGDNIFTLDYTVPALAAQGNRTVVLTVNDNQGHSDVSRMQMAVGNCANSTAPVVISQVYGGGGNSAFSGYNADFAEIFNRSGNDVNLNGWSFQSARISDAGFDSRIVFLSGIMHPGEYRLIVANQPSPAGAVLPPADFQPEVLFGMESSFGRVCLVSSTNLVHDEYTRADVVDLVGYGSSTQSFEGVGPTGTLSDILVAVRKEGGCQDNNQNALDFDVVLSLVLPHNSASAPSPCAVSRCSPADIGVQGGVPGSDRVLDNNDFIVFINFFFAQNPLADLGRQGGVTPGDGQFDNNDFIAFINYFFADSTACNGH